MNSPYLVSVVHLAYFVVFGGFSGVCRSWVSRKHRPRKRRPQTADLENADLENTDLENADLENADLENVRSFIKCMGERKFKTARAGDNHVNRYVDPKSRK